MEGYLIGNQDYKHKHNKSTISKKIIRIKFPEYINAKDFQKLQDKSNMKLKEIQKINLDLQKDNILGCETESNSIKNNFIITESNEEKKENKKIYADMFIKNQLMKKMGGRKLNNPRKYLEKKNKLFPSILLDFIHPYEYLFNHRIKNNKSNNIKDKHKNNELLLHLSDVDSSTTKNSCDKKTNYFSRNHNLNIIRKNKTETQNNYINEINPIICKAETHFFNSNISEIKSRNKKIYISTETNNISNYKSFNKKILTTNGSIKNNNIKKVVLKSLSNINERLSDIKKEIKTENQYTERNLGIKRDKKVDKILSKLLSDSIQPKISDEQTMKYIFKQIKKKNYFSELTKQYSSYLKKVFPLPIRKKFMNELLKMDVLEKREILLNSYRYKYNYDFKNEINKLEEDEKSKERKLFNNKITKMKNMNIINQNSNLFNLLYYIIIIKINAIKIGFYHLEFVLF